jgi:hypothetical protein
LQIPKSLNKPEGYDHRDALFGIPPYGGSIQLQVYYSGTTLCEEKVDNRKGYPSRDKDSSGEMEPWKSPFVLMVDRGDCTFVQKVRKAQHAGAAGVLIADNVCQCSQPACLTPDNASCEIAEPVMGDDGSGADVTIPSFLIFKQDADPIKEAIMKDQHIRVEMGFSVPAPDSRVEYDIWLSPMDPVSRPILQTFKDGAVALGKKAFFTPHMYIYDGIRAGCQFDGEDQCFNLCTNNGRYCATDPDEDLDSGISGADIVKESLRRICIWNEYGKDGIGKEWWDYSTEFMYRCGDPEKPGFFTSEECIADAMTHAGVEKKIVDICMTESGGLDGDVADKFNGTNSVLEKEITDQAASGVVRTPAFFVNQAPVLGSLSFSTVFKAICAGYAPGSEPAVCEKCASCLDEAGCVMAGKCSSGGSSTPGVSIPAFAGSLALVSVIFAVVGMIQYRRQQLHMRNQVRGILAEYMPLDENQKNHNDTSMGIPDTETELEFTIS